ncbi:MAG: hypothetical protein KC910_11855 [Candidatus Eremiobacteraeota bacterium]|nr:hypothetical protein [Candidatus Eremiobacteraeota bacterium]
MKTRRRGLALITVLGIVALLIIFEWSATNSLSMAHHHIKRDSQQHRAHSLAVAGLDYARGMAGRGQLQAADQWRSPSFQGAYFELSTRRAGTGWKVVSVGVAGKERDRLEEVVR